ncbi:hypothetical protein EDF70_102436 [Neorhizobium sp. JUb45]|nr:hypothetical protein EDF70_102436 [Neorhizobium sp. JUb45]
MRRAMTAALVGLVLIIAWNIPLPGLDMAAVADQTGSSSGVGRFSIFAIWVMPLFTALALVEILRLVTGRPRPGQPVGVVETVAVGLIVIVMTVLDAGDIANALRAGDLVALEGDSFLWLTTATFLGMTALTVILCFQIRMPGFRNGFWLLWAVGPLVAMPRQFGGQFDLVRTGAVAPTGWLIFCGAHLVCVVVAIVMVALWRSACIPQGEGKDGETSAPLEILIWPFFLATWIAPMAMNVLVLATDEVLSLLADLIGLRFAGLWIFLAQLRPVYFGMAQMALSSLLIPFLVFAYVRHNRSVIRSGAPVTLIATIIALIHIAFLVASEALAWNWGISVSGMDLIAVTLTILGLRNGNVFKVAGAAPARA